MSILLTSEILSAQADQLNRGGTPVTEPWLDAAPAERADLVSLMNTAARAKRALAPVAIAPAFRARLRDGLTMAAQHKESQNILLGRREPAWGWVIGAAALGSAAGLIAIAWRSRHSQHPRQPAHLPPQSSARPAKLESAPESP